MCGSSLSKLAALEPSQCTLPCPGDASKTCGGMYFWEVYYGPNTTTRDGGCYMPSANPTSPGFDASATYSFSSTMMTRSVCSNACQDRKSDWAGLLNGNT